MIQKYFQENLGGKRIIYKNGGAMSTLTHHLLFYIVIQLQTYMLLRVVKNKLNMLITKYNANNVNSVFKSKKH